MMSNLLILTHCCFHSLQQWNKSLYLYTKTITLKKINWNCFCGYYRKIWIKIKDNLYCFLLWKLLLEKLQNYMILCHSVWWKSCIFKALIPFSISNQFWIGCVVNVQVFEFFKYLFIQKLCYTITNIYKEIFVQLQKK